MVWGVVAMLFVLAPLAVALVPPVVMTTRHRWSLPAVVWWLLALGLLVVQSAVVSGDIDRADATGGEGSIWVGTPWLVAAAVASGAAVRTAVRRVRPPAVQS